MHGWSNHKHIDNIAADSVWIETDLAEILSNSWVQREQFFLKADDISWSINSPAIVPDDH
jgi:hypothetical protein